MRLHFPTPPATATANQQIEKKGFGGEKDTQMHHTVLIPSLRFLFFPCRNANVVVPLAFSIKSTKQRVPTTLFQQLRVAMACPKETAKEGKEKDQGKKKKTEGKKEAKPGTHALLTKTPHRHHHPPPSLDAPRSANDVPGSVHATHFWLDVFLKKRKRASLVVTRVIFLAWLWAFHTVP